MYLCTTLLMVFPFIIVFLTFSTTLLVLLSILLGWFIFRSYVQVKVYKVVKQNEIAKAHNPK